MNIIITGASKGIGKAIAAQFAAEANNLWLCARNEQQLQETAHLLRIQFPQSVIHTAAADLSTRSGVLAFADWCKQSCASVDILVNNAGQFIPGSVHTEAEGNLEKMMETNLYSAYYLTRALVNDMITKKSGHIFNICSIASVQAYANGGSYSISKFALLGFSKNLREELKPYHVKVTSVLPGAAYSDSWSGSGIEPGRIMEADDIAKMVLAASHLSPRACVEEILLRPQLGDL